MATDVQLVAVVDDVADAREYRYDVPFKFTSKINRVTFNLGEERYSNADRKKLQEMAEAYARAKD